MHTTRTDSICEQEDIVKDICVYARKYTDKDEMRFQEMNNYVVYYCSLNKPMLRCPCWMATKYYNFWQDKLVKL